VRDVRRRGRNRIEVSPFDPDAPWHGHGGASIVDAWFCSPDGERLCEIAGADEVELRVACHAEREVLRPIVGFLLRDRLGQNVFGDNTYPAYRDVPRPVRAGEAFTAAFRFQLPYMAVGEYALTVAITEGTQEDHIHVHWIEEAVILTVRESPVHRGIVAIPARDVRIDVTASVPGSSGYGNSP
jgi:lipopolysaccharide transport system ATP-binding protein